jgi:hypothetical protein
VAFVDKDAAKYCWTLLFLQRFVFRRGPESPYGEGTPTALNEGPPSA